MTLPRILHRIYARVRGYRWKPCPICKRGFGAHEAATVLLYVSPGNSESVCEGCAYEALGRNAWRLAVGLEKSVQTGRDAYEHTFSVGGIDYPEAS